ARLRADRAGPRCLGRTPTRLAAVLRRCGGRTSGAGRAMASLIDLYLVELQHELGDAPDLVSPILREIEDHLLESAQRRQAAGATLEEAQRQAIEHFGLPQVIAELFAAEVAALQGGSM